MRTNIDLDEELLKKAFEVSEARTKKDLVHEALAEYIAMKSRKDLRDLAGRVELSEDYDYKALRSE
jgi:Arc/MetJ family transcription regulator